MSNPQLNDEQLEQAHKLLDEIREKVNTLAGKDQNLIFAFRRKIYKQLMYDERGTPSNRRKLKELMWKKQKGVCPICGNDLPLQYTVLDRFEAVKGYVENNVRLICSECDKKTQAERGYK